MKADRILKILRPFSNVLRDYLIEIEPTGAEQANNISCPVLPRTVDFPIPIRLPQITADSLQ